MAQLFAPDGEIPTSVEIRTAQRGSVFANDGLTPDEISAEIWQDERLQRTVQVEIDFVRDILNRDPELVTADRLYELVHVVAHEALNLVHEDLEAAQARANVDHYVDSSPVGAALYATGVIK